MATSLHSIEASGVGRWMREALWAYPAVETMHIVGLALLFGSIVIVDLRLLGLGRNVSAAAVTRNVLPWTVTGFFTAAATGSLMFTAHAAEFVALPIFLIKMGLIVFGGVNAALLRIGALNNTGQWDVDLLPPLRVRVAAGVSLFTWICVIACGRLLAYF
jgi:uncharacterized protein DUF6644